MNAGASCLSQLEGFFIVFAFGLAAGALSPLYAINTSKLNKLITDFFAVILDGGIFYLALEIGAGGNLRLFTALAFALGFFISAKPSIWIYTKLSKSIKNALSKTSEKRKAYKKLNRKTQQ